MSTSPTLWLRTYGAPDHVAALEMRPETLAKIEDLYARYERAMDAGGFADSQIHVNDPLVPIRFFECRRPEFGGRTLTFVRDDLSSYDLPQSRDGLLSMHPMLDRALSSRSIVVAQIGRDGLSWECYLRGHAEEVQTARLDRVHVLLARCALADERTLRERFLALADHAPMSALDFFECGLRLPDDPRPPVEPGDVLRPEDMAPFLQSPSQSLRLRAQGLLATLRGRRSRTTDPRPRTR